jgi:hypothetical protein
VWRYDVRRHEFGHGLANQTHEEERLSLLPI